MANKGILVVVSGFSGAGKGTITKELLRRYPKRYALSISATTRPKREEDAEGVTYFFKTREQFEEMIQNGELIEHAEYNGNLYGTPKAYVEESLLKGKDIILEIEVLGGDQIKKQFPDCVRIFVTAPSVIELEGRLRGRGSETEGSLKRRLQRAVEESEYMDRYDYILINDNLEEAIADLHNIVVTAHKEADRNSEFISKIQSELKQYREEHLL